MIHLLPIRLAVLVIIVLTATLILALFEPELFFHKLATVLSWIMPASIFVTIIPCLAWRWIPSLQRTIFPYLGGEWEGTLEFTGNESKGVRSIRMNISHSLLRFRITLDTQESTSKTLAIYVERNTGIKRHRLYYIYLNERKEGLINAGDTYRGLASSRDRKH